MVGFGNAGGDQNAVHAGCRVRQSEKKVSAHGRSLCEWCKCGRERKSPIDHGYLNCLSAPGEVKWSCIDSKRISRLVVQLVLFEWRVFFGVALPGEAPE